MTPKHMLAALVLSFMATMPVQLLAQEGDDGGATEEIEDFMCPDANIFSDAMMNSVCWDCLFPIKIAGQDVAAGDHKAAPGAANTGFCYCPGCGMYGRFGVTVGYWSPSRIMEIVKHPYCFPSLGGEVLSDYSPFVSKIQVGRQGGSGHDVNEPSQPGLAHFHYYTYPVLAILGMMDQYDCIDDGMDDFDMLFMSEISPNWVDDSMAIFLNPEAALFANVAAWLVQPVECVSATTAYRPVDKMFWIAGCWGSFFPLTGYTAAGTGSPVHAASLRASRAMFMLHRIGLAKRQGGNDAVCKGVRETTMTKSFYRQQQFWPMPESGEMMESDEGGEGGEGDGSAGAPFGLGSMLPVCCHAIGASSTAWGEWRYIPVVGEENLQLMWRWIDCCVGVCI